MGYRLHSPHVGRSGWKALAGGRYRVHRRKVLATVAITVFSSLVKERAIAIVARLVAQEGRAIFGGSVLRSKDTITVPRAIHGPNARRCIEFAGEGHVNTNSLVGVAAGLSLADHDLLNLAILTEIFPSTERLKELIFVSDRRVEADNVDQVLLDNTDTGQVLPTGSLDFPFFGFLLFRSSRLAVFQCQICLEPKHSRLVGMWRRYHRAWVDSLLNVGNLVLDGTFIVSAPTVRASSFFILRFNVVVAELANLKTSHVRCGTRRQRRAICLRHNKGSSGRDISRITIGTYLISTRTRFKILIGQIELFNAQGAVG